MAGIYIHVPFCKSRCIYCDFYSTTQADMKRLYVQALCSELRMRHDYLKGEPIETVYLGGGTPSQLDKTALKQIFDTLQEVYGLEHVREVTLEANPDDLTEEYITMLCTLPINRISMGVQTFNDDLLRLLKRRHTAQQVHDAVKSCKQAGLSNISLDLIYGLPGQTEEMWANDIRTAIALHPKHLSAYMLTYEEGTPLWQMRTAGKVKEADEELCSRMYMMLTQAMREAGFIHYEISNFCRGPWMSRHNMSYWTGVPYLGCGPGAHSYDGESREWNLSSLEQYVEGMKKGERPYERETLTLDMRYNEYVMTRMRTRQGLSTRVVKMQFGYHRLRYLLKAAAIHLKRGTLIQHNSNIRLTEEAYFVSDGIISDLMYTP